MNEIEIKSSNEEKRTKERKKLKEETKLLEKKIDEMKKLVIYICLIVVVIFCILIYFNNQKQQEAAINQPTQEQLTSALIYSIDIDEAKFGTETSGPYFENKRQMVQQFKLDTCVYDEPNSQWLCRVFFKDREAELILEKTDRGYVIKKS